MYYLIYLMIVLPLCAAGFSFSPLLNEQQTKYLSRATSIVNLVIWCLLYFYVQDITCFTNNFFRLDALSIWFLMVLAIMYILVCFVSESYLQREKFQYENSPNYINKYYALLHVFMAIMLLVLVLDNLGLMWVCIEATTLVSALLVSFKFTRLAVEAAWKYVMVCTVGICLALLGTIILYYAQLNALGQDNALNWGWLMNNAASLDPNIVKFAFFFIFIGYATKLGLAPMHTWLPDAYSQAPSPISGLLSGGLSTCVVYVLIKNLMLIKSCIDASLVNSILIFFGLLSILIALPFLLVQRELKRLLAYSSVENMGLIAIALGINSHLAATGLLMHILNHALIKFNLFYLASRIIHDFKTNNMMRIHGMLIASPSLARTLLITTIAVAGMPPFGMFFSKMYIVQALFIDGFNFISLVLLVLLVGIFLGFFYHIMRMLCDRSKNHNLPVFQGEDKKIIYLSIILSILSCIFLTEFAGPILQQANAILGGGR